MQNLSRWEHAVGAAPIDDELKMSLMFLRDRVVRGEPRTVDSGVGKVFHLYTDACYENGRGGLGGVLYNELGEMLSYFSAHVTEAQAARLNPLGKDTIIFEDWNHTSTAQWSSWTTMVSLGESSLEKVDLASMGK